MTNPTQYTARTTFKGEPIERTYSNPITAYAFFRRMIANSLPCRVVRAEYAADTDTPVSVSEVTAAFADKLQGVA